MKIITWENRANLIIEGNTMKNNRRLDLSEYFIKKHNLSTELPPKDSLFWQMWNACTSIANQTLETLLLWE